MQAGQRKPAAEHRSPAGVFQMLWRDGERIVFQHGEIGELAGSIDPTR